MSDFSFGPNTGTTIPMHIPEKPDPVVVQRDKAYFVIKIHSAQAVYRGSLWQRAKKLAVTSQVNLNSPLLGNQPITAIQQYRDIHNGQREQLGLAPNLVNLVPATMDKVTFSIDFLLDTSNRLLALSGLINDKTFISDISFLPGVAAVAQQIGNLSQKIIQTFMEPQERIPILQFSGDFNLIESNSPNSLKEGYYAILGNRDPNASLPTDPKQFRLNQTGQLLYSDTSPVESLSYVVLEVITTPTRGGRGNQSNWDKALTKAETRAEETTENPFASDDDKKAAWNDCMRMLSEAKALLDDDPSYLATEKKQIYQASYIECRNRLFPNAGHKPASETRGGLESLGSPLESLGVEEEYPNWLDTEENRQFLDIPGDLDLGQARDEYLTQVAHSNRILGITN